MERLFTRRSALGLAGGIGTAALVASCAGGEGPTAPEASRLPAPTEAGGPQAATCGTGSWEPAFPEGFQKFDPPVKVTATWQPSAGLQFEGGGSFDNNPMYNRLKDTLGIEYEAKFQANTSVWTEKLSQVIAAGDLPDVIPLNGADLAGIIDNDGAEEIREVWEATASPLVKQKREYPDGAAWSVASRGEQLFGVPYNTGPGYNTDTFGYIRTDLLDEVGASMPETVDQFGDTLRELKGRGLVEYGLATCKSINTYTVSMDPIFVAHGAVPQAWRDNGQGGLEYGSVQPGAKEALQTLATWYADGLMDPDFYTKTIQDALPLVYSGKQAAMFGPWFSSQAMVPHEEANPGVEWGIFGNPKGPNGDAGRIGSPTFAGAVVFRAGVDRQVIEAVITQLNWSTEMHVNWAKYHQYGEYTNSSAWTEGYEFVVNDCEIEPGPVGSQYLYLNMVGFNYPALAYPDYQSDVFSDILAWRDQPEGELNLSQQLILSNDALIRSVESYDYAFQTRELGLVNEFIGASTETMLKKQADLDQLELETFTKIIVGQSDISAFDDFVKAWHDNGGEQITAEVNEWKQQQG